MSETKARKFRFPTKQKAQELDGPLLESDYIPSGGVWALFKMQIVTSSLVLRLIDEDIYNQ